MRLTRRELIKTGAALATAYFLPSGARRVLASPGSNKVLVAIFLRGGADALSLVVPAFDATYYSVRPDIAVPAGVELQLGSGDSHGFGFFPLLHRSQADVRPTASWWRCISPAAPTRRVRTSMRRTSWRRPRPATSRSPTAG